MRLKHTTVRIAKELWKSVMDMGKRLAQLTNDKKYNHFTEMLALIIPLGLDAIKKEL